MRSHWNQATRSRCLWRSLDLGLERKGKSRKCVFSFLPAAYESSNGFIFSPTLGIVILILVILIDMLWHLSVVWICISLRIDDVEYLLRCLFIICKSFSVYIFYPFLYSVHILYSFLNWILSLITEFGEIFICFRYKSFRRCTIYKFFFSVCLVFSFS